MKIKESIKAFGAIVALMMVAMFFQLLLMSAWVKQQEKFREDLAAQIRDTIEASERGKRSLSELKIETEKLKDHFKSFTAEEADKWLQCCEDTPENRKKWAEAGTPMKFEKKP